MTIEREIKDARSTRDAGANGKRKESQSSSSSRKKQKDSSSREFQSRGHPRQGRIKVANQAGQMALQAARTYEEGLPSETGILGFQDNAVPVSGGKGADTVYSSTP